MYDRAQEFAPPYAQQRRSDRPGPALAAPYAAPLQDAAKARIYYRQTLRGYPPAPVSQFRHRRRSPYAGQAYLPRPADRPPWLREAPAQNLPHAKQRQTHPPPTGTQGHHLETRPAGRARRV